MNRPSNPTRPLGAARRRGGFSLVEVVVAAAVMAVAMLGLSRSMVSSVRVTAGNRETSLALEAAQEAVERLQAAAFADVFALYNADPKDDPDGEVGPGASFAVEGLSPQDDDADGAVGEFVFPTASNGSGELRENAVNIALGMPRDLDGDGKIDMEDHAGDYQVLPVLVRVAWRTTS